MDDTEIIQLYWERCETAISQTANKYGKLCKYISTNILSCEEDIDECVNDVYLVAWNKIPPEKPNSLSAFLCKITRNLSLKKFEHNTAQKRNYGVILSLSELEECVSGSDSRNGQYDRQPIQEILSVFLRNLRYEERNVFMRRYWFFDSIRDIAKRFMLSESKITSMLFRIRNKLRLYLEKEGIQL